MKIRSSKIGTKTILHSSISPRWHTSRYKGNPSLGSSGRLPMRLSQDIYLIRWRWHLNMSWPQQFALHQGYRLWAHDYHCCNPLLANSSFISCVIGGSQRALKRIPHTQKYPLMASGFIFRQLQPLCQLKHYLVNDWSTISRSSRQGLSLVSGTPRKGLDIAHIALLWLTLQLSLKDAIAGTTYIWSQYQSRN